MRGRGEREIPEKTRGQTVSSGAIPTCKNPVTRPGIEPGSPQWEESCLRFVSYSGPWVSLTNPSWKLLFPLDTDVETDVGLNQPVAASRAVRAFQLPGRAEPQFMRRSAGVYTHVPLVELH
ncbi:hypothetical protein PR048_014928, partial [Dryococelus australis]